jgi:hypothetical protein
MDQVCLAPSSILNVHQPWYITQTSAEKTVTMLEHLKIKNVITMILSW